MHVFIPDDSILTHSLDIFVSLYTLRKIRNQEYWLLDVSDFEYIDGSMENLKTLPLDLDDNLFLYKHGNNSKNEISVTEYYEIHSSHPRKLRFYGNWNKISGLKVTEEDKWNRRKNLEVSICYSNSFQKINHQFLKH